MIGLPIAGLPCLTLTVGSHDGRPLGVQILAGRFREDLCRAAGAAIESRGADVRVAL